MSKEPAASGEAAPGSTQFPYPRRVFARRILQVLSRTAFAVLTDLHMVGRENLPSEGPLIVVANHFSFADPAAIVRVAPWPLDFLGGFQMPDAPAWALLIPKLWGIYAVRRGGASRRAIRASLAVLRQKGVLGIFPEGGSWADVLRPARPGTAYLAARTGVPLLPIGLDGLVDVFPSLRRGRRARVTIRIGKPFGPFHSNGRRPGRDELDEIGDEIMRHIAALLPPERHGVYSTDPDMRRAAEEVAAWPFEDADGI
ncbi:MAG: lysophospholipid acyltransferase family protein [Anaerolineae bacterium]|jgi:1-acyl-sn-glycerol-3-phosphate acyltransferase